MLSQKLKNAPEFAGIYQFFNASGMLLYVGKAKNIKNRVKSYFRFSGTLAPSPTLSLRITKMILEVSDVEFIVVQSEHDALILENSLIKQLKPKYNILLRDDKTYPYIAINLAERFARFEITRKIVDTKHTRYFGPLSGSAKALLEALYLVFPLVQKKGCLKGKKACLFFQIGRCLAPCEGRIAEQDYREIVEKALSALSDQRKLLALLDERMQEASLKLNFEEAAHLRDTKIAIQNALHVTHVELKKLEDYDVFAIEATEKTAVVMRLFIRHGKIVSTSHSLLHNVYGFEKDELYQRALFEFYYPMNQSFATRVLTAEAFSEQAEMERFLSEKFQQKIEIFVPQKGEKYALTTMARHNAQEILLQSLSKNQSSFAEQLQNLFDLTTPPRRIEIFDNSHHGGSAPVGAMVVWEDGFAKNAYRRYALCHSDEYAQMHEMLTRRIEDFAHEPAPDLWVLDGGETLLKLARSLLEKHRISVDLLAIAKEKRDAKAYRAKGNAHDTVYNLKQAFVLPAHDKRLQFIQRLRDEAHRFAIAYHRSKKRKNDLSLELQNIEGIGQATIQKLLNYFGSFEALYAATQEELEVTVGKKNATNIINFLKK